MAVQQKVKGIDQMTGIPGQFGILDRKSVV